MRRSLGFLMPVLIFAVFAVCFATADAQNAPGPQFTARELFYSAASAPAPAKEPPKTPPPTPKKATAPPKKATTAPPATTPPDGPVVRTTHTQPVRVNIPPGALPGGGAVIQASAAQRPSSAPAPVTGTPLGLKYTILRKSGDDMLPVPPDTVFHAGDRIQLKVETNSAGYLYVVHQGSSGTWTPMFPTPDLAESSNYVNGWSSQILPPKSRMLFDDQTGTEKIFVVFSRTPEEGLEKLIYSLQGGHPKPAAAPDNAPPRAKVQIASADIDDGTVGLLRDSYTRDLIIEKVDEKTAPDKSSADSKEYAVYVVNPTGSNDSRVVADILLVHQ